MTQDFSEYPATSDRLDLEVRGREIVECRGGRWTQTGGMCRCPAHADATPSLSVRIGDRDLLFHCFAGCRTIDVLRALRRGGQFRYEPLSRPERSSPRRATTGGSLIAWLWSQGRDLQGTLAFDYLRRRGLAPGSAQLRFHPRVQLGPENQRTFHPALLAAVRDDTGLVAVHRTFLDPATATKASFRNPRRMLGAPGRGTVRFGTPGEVLGLAEGLETALAAGTLLNIPVWAVLGNERFGDVALPARIRTLVLLADNDAGGRRAVALARSGPQHTRCRCKVVWPPAPHNDWADVLAARRGEGVVPG